MVGPRRWVRVRLAALALLASGGGCAGDDGGPLPDAGDDTADVDGTSPDVPDFAETVDEADSGGESGADAVDGDASGDDDALAPCQCDAGPEPCRPCVSGDTRCTDESTLVECNSYTTCLTERSCEISGPLGHCMTWSDDRFACTHCDPPGHECSTADDCVLPDCPVEQRRCNTYTYDCHYCPAVWDGRCEYYPATGSSCACEAA